MHALIHAFRLRERGPLSGTQRKIVVLLYVGFCCAALGSSAEPRRPREDTQAPDYSKEPFVVEKNSTTAVFENDGTYSLEVTERAHIQSQAGVQQFGLLHFPYASATTTMEIVYVHVIKPDNRVIETPPENALDMPAEITQQAPFYSDLKDEQVAVKGLEIGDTLEYQCREQVRTPLDPGQFWFSYNFFQNAIALEEDLQISVPRDRYVKVQSPKVQPTTAEQGAYRVFTWKTANLEREPETKGAASSEPETPQFPSVQLTTFHSWDEVGQWFRSLVAPRAVPTPEIQAKANELIRGAKTDSEKTQAIYNFVSTKFRYIGISLGIGRYQPHAAADVLANNYGDCKDKHTLFAALLAAVGVKAYPSLISSTGEIDPEVPSPSQFDHVITAIPQDKGFLFLDTTPEVAPFGYLEEELRDKKALVIPDNGPAVLVQTPPDPPFKSYFTFQADGALDDTGTLVSKMQMTFRGDVELVYRLVLRQAGQTQWKDMMQRISSNLGFGGTVSDVTATSPDATDVPFHIEYSYHRDDYGDWSNKRITPPFPPIFLPAAPNDADKSSKPIRLGSPRELSYKATIKLPANSDPQVPPPVFLHENFAEYHAAYSYSASDGVMHFERQLITEEREIAPEQIEAYRKFEKAIEEDENTFTPLFRGTSSDTAGTAEAQALYEQGSKAWYQNDMPGALDAFQRAVDKDPKFARGWTSLGAVQIESGKTDQGVEEMKKGVVLDPTQATVYKRLGTLLVVWRRQDDALRVWRELERANPEDPDAPENIAAILLSMKRYSDALPELEAAVKRNPANTALSVQLGVAYSYTGSREKALAAFQQAMMFDSTAGTLNTVASALADNNFQLDYALSYAEKAVKETEDATAGLSLDTAASKDIDMMGVLAKDWETFGWVQFRMGDLGHAEKYMDAGWSLIQDPETADHLGQLYEKQGKKHEAAVAYSRALSAGHAPEETQARLDAIRPGGKFQAGEGIDPIALQNLRTVKLAEFAPKPGKHASADFFMLFAPGRSAVGVKFISGSDELRDAGKTLAAVKLDVHFPDDGPFQILRRGILDCEPEIHGCTLVLYLIPSVHLEQ